MCIDCAHILKFTDHWHKGLLLVLFQSYFQYASGVHENLYKPEERTSSGKQTVAFDASILWDNIPVDLKKTSSIFQKN